jgi:hypothetical protein
MSKFFPLSILAASALSFGAVWIATSPSTASAAKGSASVYYPNCDAARAAGAAPLRVGDAGYRARLDRDGDGRACEPYKGGNSGSKRGKRRRRR